METVRDSEAPIKEIYGQDHTVSPRAWAGNFALDTQSPELAEYVLLHSVNEDTTREAIANAVLGLSVNEPRVMPLEQHFHVLLRWFENDVEKACFLPRTLADTLLITEDAVAAGEATVELSGTEYAVLGIFNEDAFDNMLDLDGQSMMPLDIRFASRPDQFGGGDAATGAEAQEVPEDLPRLPAAQVVITPKDATGTGRPTIASIAVKLDNLGYADARALIDSHLERSGQATYFAIEGNAFFGGRMRLGTLEGIIDLILPIVIAALTVLNTMYGSVYERKNELYVFSAVGLAPNHIRWLFFAEAMVYAVVGAVGGYLLAQALVRGSRCSA